VAGVLMSGASGLIGSALAPRLESRGYELYRLVRRPPDDSREREYHPDRPIAPSVLSGIDVVIHLAGEGIAGRWTPAKKIRIRDSRVVSTHNLATALILAERRPKVFLSASAIGFYGDRGNEILTETASPGDGFLAEVCQQWEEATYPIRQAGVRTVNLRIGVVLAPNGGALKAMLLPFRLGLGGKVGGGRQWWSWIHIWDLVAAVVHVLECQNLSGPVNITAPQPAMNREFTRTLAKIVKRPALLPIPRFLAQAVLGEFAREGLLASARVMPKKLLETGFEFRFPELAGAVKDILD
jgi:uncharacterized protein (TIGR01777 family)